MSVKEEMTDAIYLLYLITSIYDFKIDDNYVKIDYQQYVDIDDFNHRKLLLESEYEQISQNDNNDQRKKELLDTIQCFNDLIRKLSNNI